MNYQLRTYQSALIAKIVDAWQRKKRRVIAVAPTGSGKTLIFAKLIEQYLSKNDKQVLVVAHREELILQAQAKIATFTTLPIGIIKYGYPPNLNAPIQIASIQSLSRNLEDIEINPRLIIIDEVHHDASESRSNGLTFILLQTIRDRITQSTQLSSLQPAGRAVR